MRACPASKHHTNFPTGPWEISFYQKGDRGRPAEASPASSRIRLRCERPVTRLSAYFLPTEREPPADAEAISHKLMVRAGLIRQVGAGLWTWLPAGWRVHQKRRRRSCARR